MKRVLSVVLVLMLLLASVGCELAKTGRDTAAALSGAIESAQNKHLDECKANPTLPVCTSINRAVAAQNALITALETYCGWSVNEPPPLDSKCVPVKSAEGALQAALNNAKPFVGQMQAVAQ